MPEEEVKGKDDAQQTVDVAAPADKTKSVVMIMIGLSILVMIATPLITFFTMRTMINSQSATTAAKDTKKFEDYGETVIKGHKAIISGTNAGRYVSMDIVIQYTEPAKTENYFKEKTADNPDGMLNAIKDAITKIVMDKPIQELETKDALKKLADQIKEDINNMLPKDTGKSGMVTNILFPNFLIS